MIIHKDIEQGEDKWFAIKAGKISTSNFSLMMAKGKAVKGKTKESFGLVATGYARKLAAERYFGINFSPEDFKSYDMIRGNELEPLARLYYEEETFQDVELITGIENKGCFSSTDGITPINILEIKCPKYNTHLKYMSDITILIDQDYKLQLQGELFVCERERVDILSFHPSFQDKQIIHEVYRNEKVIKQIENRIPLFEELIEKEYQNIKNFNL